MINFNHKFSFTSRYNELDRLEDVIKFFNLDATIKIVGNEEEDDEEYEISSYKYEKGRIKR